jgi:hypothetical protein
MYLQIGDAGIGLSPMKKPSKKLLKKTNTGSIKNMERHLVIYSPEEPDEKLKEFEDLTFEVRPLFKREGQMLYYPVDTELGWRMGWNYIPESDLEFIL